MISDVTFFAPHESPLTEVHFSTTHNTPLVDKLKERHSSKRSSPSRNINIMISGAYNQIMINKSSFCEDNESESELRI